MQAYMYSNVGFRCESAYLAFTDYLQRRQVNPLIFNDSKRILNDCLQIEKNDENSLYFNEQKSIEIESIQNILYDYIMAQNDKKAVFIKLRQIYSNIGNIENLEDDQVKELCDFFKEIVKLCKDKTQYNYQYTDDSNWR